MNRWNTAEIRQMREMRNAGATRKEIAARLSRTEASVKAQLERFRAFISRPKRPVCPCCKRVMP